MHVFYSNRSNKLSFKMLLLIPHFNCSFQMDCMFCHALIGPDHYKSNKNQAIHSPYIARITLQHFPFTNPIKTITLGRVELVVDIITSPTRTSYGADQLCHDSSYYIHNILKLNSKFVAVLLDHPLCQSLH